MEDDNQDDIETAEVAEPEGGLDEPVIEYDTDHFLRISSKKITFEGNSKAGLTSVYFDESSAQIFSILSGDVTEVTVRSPYPERCHFFRMEEKGRVTLISFSPDRQGILALQRTQNSIEFLTIADGKVTRDFSEPFPKGFLLGFVWSGRNEIVYIASNYIKVCRVDMKECRTFEICNHNYHDRVNWYKFYSPMRLLLVNIGHRGNSFQLHRINENDHSIQKIGDNFDIDVDLKSREGVSSEDVTLWVVYNQPRILIMNYVTANGKVIRTEVVIYTVQKLSRIKKTHVLRIQDVGRFALNIVDNLIIVHNQVSKSSMVFDISDRKWSKDGTSSGGVTYHEPVVEPRSLKAFENQPTASTFTPKVVELYSKNWITFKPDYVMDAKLGYFWALELNLPGFCENMSDKKTLIKFLLLRSGSKYMITKAVAALAEQPSQLVLLGEIFDLINKNYYTYLEQFIKRRQNLPLSLKEPEDETVEWFIDQNFMHNQVFSKLAEKLHGTSDTKGHKVLTWVLLEYIRSLADHQIPTKHFIYELLIKMMVTTKNFYQLHQLLQFYAVDDSKPLATFLLSLENIYPASTQLALDMLARLENSTEEIIRILLEKNEIVSCLRYSEQNKGPHQAIVPTECLDKASQSGNKRVLHAVKMYTNPHSVNSDRDG